MQKSIKVLLLASVFAFTAVGSDNDPSPKQGLLGDLRDCFAEETKELRADMDKMFEKVKALAAKQAKVASEKFSAARVTVGEAVNEASKKITAAVVGSEEEELQEDLVVEFSDEAVESALGGNRSAELEADPVLESDPVVAADDSSVDIGVVAASNDSEGSSEIVKPGFIATVGAFCSSHKYKLMASTVVITACGIAAYVYYKNRYVTQDELEDEADAADLA